MKPYNQLNTAAKLLLSGMLLLKLMVLACPRKLDSATDQRAS